MSAPLPNVPPSPPKGDTWTKTYDCGCQASGGKGIHDYCPEHGTAPAIRVRAKFRLNSYETQLDYRTKEELRSLKLSVVTDGSPENKEFFKYTPNGHIEIGVLNPSAWKQFELDKEYYVDFTPASQAQGQG